MTMVNDNTEGLKVAHYGNYINLNNARFLTGDCGISRSESEVDLTTEGILLFLLVPNLYEKRYYC